MPFCPGRGQLTGVAPVSKHRGFLGSMTLPKLYSRTPPHPWVSRRPPSNASLLPRVPGALSSLPDPGFGEPPPYVVQAFGDIWLVQVAAAGGYQLHPHKAQGVQVPLQGINLLSQCLEGGDREVPMAGAAQRLNHCSPRLHPSTVMESSG